MVNIRKFRLPINVIAVLLSVVALAISLRSCQISNEALRLSQTDFSSSRTLILIGEFVDQGQNVIFRSKSTEMELASLAVYTPVDFSEMGVAFKPYATLTMPVGYWEIPNEFQDVIKTTYESSVFNLEYAINNETNALFAIGSMPVIITSSHITHGERFDDASIYDLEFSYRIDINRETSKIERELEFRKVYFVSRLTDKEYEELTQLSDYRSVFMIKILDKYTKYLRP